MGESNRFSKPVAFNKTNTKDMAIINHVAKRNFSGYVKKLILEDMKRSEGIKVVAPIEKTAAEKLAELKQKQNTPGTSGQIVINLAEQSIYK